MLPFHITHRRLIASVLTLLLAGGFAAGCGKSPTNPNGGSCGTVSTLHGTMTATINGAAWKSASVTTERNVPVPNGITLQGSDGCSPATIITIAFVAAAPGTFTVGVTLSGLNAILVSGGLTSWVANPAGGSGTLTLATLTATAATGTFQFTMVPAPGSGATGNRTVSGSFNVIF
jgi:hypothetical protein